MIRDKPCEGILFRLGVNLARHVTSMFVTHNCHGFDLREYLR